MRRFRQWPGDRSREGTSDGVVDGASSSSDGHKGASSKGTGDNPPGKG